MFNNFQLSQAQLLLHKNREELLDEIHGIENELEELNQLERGDFFAIELEFDLRSKQIKEQHNLIQEIDLATKRIADKSWGFCLGCASRMTKEDLAAALYRKNCSVCDSKELN